MSPKRKRRCIEKVVIPMNEWPIEMVEITMRDASRKFARSGDTKHLIRQQAAEQVYADRLTEKLNE